MLTVESRGQEFGMNCDDYPEAVNWMAELLMLAAYVGFEDSLKQQAKERCYTQ